MWIRGRGYISEKKAKRRDDDEERGREEGGFETLPILAPRTEEGEGEAGAIIDDREKEGKKGG